MKNLQEIARRVRRPEEQLRFPCELLQQGYEPNYLANYRPDELANFDEPTLSKLKRILMQFDAIEKHRAKILASLEKESLTGETIKEVVNQASSIAQIDTTLRHARARKNAKSIAEKCPAAQVLGQTILTMQGDTPADVPAWVCQVAGVTADQVDDVLFQTKTWLTHMLCEDLRLMSELQQYVLRRATVSVKVLPEPPKGSDAEKRLDATEDSSVVPVESLTPAIASSDVPTSVPTADVSDSSAASVALDASTENVASSEASNGADNSVTTETNLEIDATKDADVAPLIAEFNQGKKTSKPIKTKSLSEKQLSPRQRRRRWLRSILESYARLKKPVGNVTPYQILMLARGLRSQIIQLNFDYDKKPLIQLCRDALCPGRHPLHSFLMDVAESALTSFLLPRAHQDVLAILEEYANEELTEAAVSHLHTSLLQRPIVGHRILVIDSIGPKMAAAAIVDADGKVIFTGEIPCNSNRADIVAQNVVLLGQWIHEHRVTLLSLSNGPARRYLIQPIAELLKQSNEGSIFWTMVDRAGADGYCNSRICLAELPNISRRHRAAVWLARRLQDPLKQVLKVDPSRLRLGSYQRELPQADLEIALRDAVSAAISTSGLDVFHSEPEVLQRVPGMTLAAAKAVVEGCRSEKISNRETLLAVLKEHLSEMQARQAIGFLRVYGSTQPLDATSIHPDDYRLAERLIEHAKLPVPPALPEGWNKPNFKALAEVNAAAEAAFAKQQSEFGASLDEMHSEDVHPEEEPSESIQDGSNSIATSDEQSVSATEETSASPAETFGVESATAAEDSKATESSTESAPSDGTPNADGTSNETSANADVAPSEATSSEPVAAVNPNMPVIQTQPSVRTPLSIDVERLARSWQVGREKMKRVANCLQFPFADEREFQFPIPLVGKFPRLDTIRPGDMVQALVVGVTDFGVFADLGPDCGGLIHISRLTTDYVEDPHQYVQMGDLLTVWVLHVDEKKKRVALTAIPPGTPTRRDMQSSDQGEQRSDRRGGGERRPENRNENRNDGRSDNRARPARTDSGAPAQNRSAGDRPSGGDRADNRGPSKFAGNQGGRPSSGGRNDRGRNDRGRNDRGRGRDEDRDSGSRRPTRVEPPKPVTPLTEGMQQGKEPLRSFSDLMQFMKKKPETEIIPEGNSSNSGATGEEVRVESPRADQPSPERNDSPIESEPNNTHNGPSA